MYFNESKHGGPSGRQLYNHLYDKGLVQWSLVWTMNTRLNDLVFTLNVPLK